MKYRTNSRPWNILLRVFFDKLNYSMDALLMLKKNMLMYLVSELIINPFAWATEKPFKPKLFGGLVLFYANWCHVISFHK